MASPQEGSFKGATTGYLPEAHLLSDPHEGANRAGGGGSQVAFRNLPVFEVPED